MFQNILPVIGKNGRQNKNIAASFLDVFTITELTLQQDDIVSSNNVSQYLLSSYMKQAAGKTHVHTIPLW